MRPTIMIQQSTRERVVAVRAGLGDVENVVVVGMDAKAFETLPGLDAIYMSLTRAERWGARPLAPHEVGVLETGKSGAEAGFPPYVMTGLILEENEQNTAQVAVPLLVRAVLRVAAERNAARSGVIRTVGFPEFELTYAGASAEDIGRLIATSLK